jgi:hypothetical protein
MIVPFTCGSVDASSGLGVVRLGETYAEHSPRRGVIADARGMYLLGAPLLRRRRATCIDGARADTRGLVQHLHSRLDFQRRSL